MRILHIEKYLDAGGALAGGVGQYVRTLNGELSRRGHETLAFGCVGADGPATMPRLHDFNRARSPLPLLQMMHNTEAADRLDAMLRRHPVDVAHLHNIYHHLTPSILPVLARHGVGVVMTCHDVRQCGSEWRFWRWPVQPLDLDGIDDHYAAAARHHCIGPGGAVLAMKNITERLLRRYHRWIGRYLCPTRMIRRVLRDCGGPAERLRVVRNPVAALPTAEAGQRSDRLLFAGRLAVEKSPEMLLTLARRLPGAKVVVAGDGPMREPLGVAATRQQVWNLELLEHVERPRLAELYAEATAVVLTSRCTENSPASMLEAMAAGRCVMAPDQEAIREWIDDGETGRLYPTGDVEALVMVAKQVLADRRRRTRMGEAAARRIEAMHSLDDIVGAVERAYEESREIARRRCALP